MNTSIFVPVVRHARVRAWPKHAEGGLGAPTELVEALTRAYPHDAHFTAYRAPSVNRRLDSSVLAPEHLNVLGGSVEMVLAVFDIDDKQAHDSGEPSSELWWSAEKAKISGLLRDHPGLFVFRTRGGYRILGILPQPFQVKTKQDADAWTQLYYQWVAYLGHEYKIQADAVADWTRLFRLPKATRLRAEVPGETEEQKLAREALNSKAVPEDRETIGDAGAVGLWAPALTEQHAALGKTLKARRARSENARTRKHAGGSKGVTLAGEGVLFYALEARGLIGPEHSTEKGAYVINCPLREEHSQHPSFDTSTVLYPPRDGQRLGWIHCSHTGCGHDQFSSQDWEDIFTDGELADARVKAGLTVSGKTPVHYLRAPENLPPAGSSGSWEDNLRRSEKGAIMPTADNLELILAHDEVLKDAIGFDFFKDAEAVRGELVLGDNYLSGVFTENYYTAIRSYLLRKYNLNRLDAKDTRAAVKLHAAKRRFSSLQDSLRALPAWDGTKRLDTWLSTYLGVVNDEYTRAVGKWWLLGAVARAMQPGAKMDHVLVLEGARDIKKSMACEILGRGFGMAGISGRLDERLALRSIKGSWVIELEELPKLLRRTGDNDEIKAFFSRSTDKYCKLYEENASETPRQCVFIATVNPIEGEGYFTDTTGNRNWWPVEVLSVDEAALRRDRDQLFAEALAAFDAGERWWPETAHEKSLCKATQAQRMSSSLWEEPIAQFIHGKASVSVNEVLVNAVQKAPAQQTQKDRIEVVRALKALGWQKGPNRKVNGVSTKCYYAPGVDVSEVPEEVVTPAPERRMVRAPSPVPDLLVDRIVEEQLRSEPDAVKQLPLPFQEPAKPVAHPVTEEPEAHVEKAADKPVEAPVTPVAVTLLPTPPPAGKRQRKGKAREVAVPRPVSSSVTPSLSGLAKMSDKDLNSLFAQPWR